MTQVFEWFEWIDETEFHGNPQAEHIQSLAKRNKITLAHRKQGGRAWRRSRYVSTMEIKTSISYVVGLHEIGHIVCVPHGNYRLEKECFAWRWAIDHAIMGLTSQAGWRRAFWSMESYLVWAQRRQETARPPRIPELDHPFWDIREKLAQLGGLE